ncbi:hypothetical protein Tsubulata_047645 [Turnera subulata]|uniref:F-box domain-containing protein n=1 Tax=Turnera subulata TaxID=218843 RepID=A0A9Q0FN92_9ROSI|nr:hypothetical protein Tsubulata_047645 [Turnera subulata]
MRDESRLLVDQAKTTTNINCLPPEIVEEILALLPIESIHRFRSVSKSCSSLLASAEFHKLRRKSTPPPPEMINVVPKFLYHASSSPSRFSPTNIDLWVMKEYCNEASWVHFVSYSPYGRIGDVITSIPRSAKDGGYIMLQHCTGRIDVLKWINNNPEEGSDEAEEQYSNKIKFCCRHIDIMTAIPYTEALTSPFASTGIDQGFA